MAELDAIVVDHSCAWIMRVLIRELIDDEWPAVWRFMREIIAAGETFAYDPGMTEREARKMWVVDSPGRTTVAVTDSGTLAGTANMYSNRQGAAGTSRAAV